MSVVNIVADLPELIEKGQTVECLVRFYDHGGLLLPAHGYGAPNLTAKINEGRIAVNLSSNETNNGILYTVTGNIDFPLHFYTNITKSIYFFKVWK